MLECRACLIRCLRAVARDFVPPSAPFHRHLLNASRLPNAAHRRHASTAVATNAVAGNGLVPGRQPIAEEIGSAGTSKKTKEDFAISATELRHCQLEMQHLPDRVKFAEHVHYTLRCGKPAKAVNLCRLASKDREVIVAWNHCVDWHMQNNKFDEGIKIYNEMKKRAQFPDSYTYILLLRALGKKRRSDVAEPKMNNVPRAMSIYNSMSSPTSRCQPATMHTNAALYVCASAMDMDSVWSIVAKLPQSGAGAPDHITYSTILKAIRFNAVDSSWTGYSVEQVAQRRDQAVAEGRTLWRDVIARWRNGEIQIDENLVCDMARVLLASKRMEDWDSIFDLVQQTTNVERLVPRLGHPDRHTEHVPSEEGLQAQRPPEEDSDGFRDAPTTQVFRPIRPHLADSAHPKRPTTLAWVKPGNHILSVLIEACTLARTPKTANAYWELFITDHLVKPDLLNFHTLLKLLSVNRSSARAVALLQDSIIDKGIEARHQTFRRVMHVCARDKKNPNVLTNAWTVVDIMTKTQVDTDIHTVSQYLDLALATDDATQIVEAVNKLDPIVQNLQSRVNYGSDETGLSPEEHVVNKADTVKFLQTLVGVIDTLMNRGMVARETFGDWHARRGHLTQFIGRTKGVIEKQEAQMDIREAQARSRRHANEAGRREREQNWKALSRPKSRVTKDEWKVKLVNNKPKRKVVVDERKRARGVPLKLNYSHATRNAPADDVFLEKS